MSRHESTLRASVVDALRELDAIAVENPALPGTPDVNYVEGWLELKCLDAWPLRDATPLRCEHWTPEQRVRHVLRSRSGGATYVLVEVAQTHDYLLLEGAIAARILGKANRADLEAVSLALWTGRAAMRAGLLALLRRPALPKRDGPA